MYYIILNYMYVYAYTYMYETTISFIMFRLKIAPRLHDDIYILFIDVP